MNFKIVATIYVYETICLMTMPMKTLVLLYPYPFFYFNKWLWFAKLVSGLKKSWAQHTKGKVYMKTAIIVALGYCISFNLGNIDQLIFQVKPSFKRISYSKKKPCNKWIIANTFFLPTTQFHYVKNIIKSNKKLKIS